MIFIKRHVSFFFLSIFFFFFFFWKPRAAKTEKKKKKMFCLTSPKLQLLLTFVHVCLLSCTFWNANFNQHLIIVEK